MERHFADTNDAVSENAAMKAEIEALWRRIAALEREAGQPQSAPAERTRRDAPRRALPGNRNDTVALQPDPTGRIARRRVLGLGALVSLLDVCRPQCGTRRRRADDRWRGDDFRRQAQ
jgi:hypothetical protein